MDRVSRELDSAFSTVGFVYLKNHGVNQQLVGSHLLINPLFKNAITVNCLFLYLQVDNLLERSKSFFHLPESIKENYRCGVENCDGYTGRDGEMSVIH